MTIIQDFIPMLRQVWAKPDPNAWKPPCTQCGSKDVSRSGFISAVPKATLRIHCHSCGFTWTGKRS